MKTSNVKYALRIFRLAPLCLILVCIAGWRTVAATSCHNTKRISEKHFVEVGKIGALGNQSSSESASKSARPVIVSEFSDVDVKPDALLGKFWADAKRVRFDEEAFTRERYSGVETLVASRWTAKYLYLAFWCHYQELNTYKGEDPALERWELWNKDTVEAFVNPRPEDPSPYYEFEVAPTNQWIDLKIDLNRQSHDPKWNSGFEHASRIDAARHIWTAEMRIPIRSMKAKEITPSTEWKLNFYRNDGSGTGSARREMSWGPLPLPGTFHQPASFGTIRFAGPGN